PLRERLVRADGSAWPEAEQLLDELDAERAHAAEVREHSGAWARLGSLAAMFTAAGVLLGRRARRPGGGPPPASILMGALPAVTLVATYAAALGARGYRPTFSKMTPQDRFVCDALLAAGASALPSILVARRLRQGAWSMLAWAVPPFALLAAWV